MTKSKKQRATYKNNIIKNTSIKSLPQADVVQSQPNNKPCEPYVYIKNDLKWSSVAAGIVAIVLIIAYIFIH
jgi:hypothetical protein